ncbi:hypothetical protein DY000_02044913 [Brassica cretica]|uniref:Neprosin PEP catalytic domain-containing protein n=1 Tax=Brassica cretica TaxID=69181 RepID=A0ABQ7EM15_BRACR|nr:hypothetical protein DY000_02044913 [Brassica cretica]
MQRDAYLKTGCYSTQCVGFVHVSNTIALEAAITRTSTYGGDQFAITLQLWKDVFTGNWWMGMGENIVPIGYWPAEIFTSLSDHATTVQWGGEVYRNTSGRNTTLQMGSGNYPNKGFRQAAYFCNIRIAKENRTLLPIEDFVIGGTQLDSYTIRKSHSKVCGTHFYYGGPGPLRSASVRGDYLSIVYLLLLSFYFLV